ncbi:21099_t:CDS:2, partial [Gigaspora rosea]
KNLRQENKVSHKDTLMKFNKELRYALKIESIVGDDRNGNYANFMNVLNANTLTWSQPNTIANVLTPRGGYTANLLNNSYIIYIGGLHQVNRVYSNVDMNEHAYGDVVTARHQTSSRSPNYNTYLFDVQNYAWVTSSQPNSLPSTTSSTISSTTSPTTSSSTSSSIASSTNSNSASTIGQGTSGIIISAIVVGGFIFIFIIFGFLYFLRSRNSRDKPIPTPGTFNDETHVIPTPGTNDYRFHNDYTQNLRDSK